MSSPWVGGSKTPPYSVHAEKTMLGAVIVEPKLMSKMAKIIAGGDVFFRSQHGQLYDAMLAVHQKRQKPDMAALVKTLADRGQLEAVGGQSFLMELADGAREQGDPVEHAVQIRDKALLRRLIDAASDTLTEAYRGQLRFEELLARARARLDALTEPEPDPDAARTAPDAVG